MQRRSDWFVGAVADVARLRELPVLLNSGEPSYVAGVCSPWLGRLLVGDVVVAAVIFLVRWLAFPSCRQAGGAVATFAQRKFNNY